MSTAAATGSNLCANCHQAPVFPGFPYCSKRCGREAKTGGPIGAAGGGSGFAGGSVFNTQNWAPAPPPTYSAPPPPLLSSTAAQYGGSAYGAPLYDEDEEDDAYSYNSYGPPLGSYPDDEEEDDGMCLQCGERPKFGGHEYCGRTCGRAAKNGVPPARKGRPSASALPSQSTFHNTGFTQAAPPPKYDPCKIPGCHQAEDVKGSGYCSDRHRKQGVEHGIDPPCLGCHVMPRVNTKNIFCSKKCQNDAMKKAPMLLEVPQSDPRFLDVSSQFTKAWKHTKKPPRVARVFKIVLPQKSLDAYDAYKAKVESEGNFSSNKMEAGNERRRWHGTRRQCRIGDDGKNLKTCGSSSCAVCCILKSSYDVKFAATGMFGKGIYTSATSSKSDTYTRGPAPGSPYKSMFLNRVVVGKGKVLTAADNSLRAPPAGHHSIIANPGQGLNYDELIVYENNAIRPSWLLLYDAVVN